jgi:hypothetical protein
METSKGGALDTSAVLAFLRQELTKVYLPDHIVHLPEGLPRTGEGCIAGLFCEMRAAHLACVKDSSLDRNSA